MYKDHRYEVSLGTNCSHLDILIVSGRNRNEKIIHSF